MIFGKKKIGLALGSGAAKGGAHIGVLRALKEAEIPIHYIAGTSIGSMIAAIFCSGQLEAFEEFVRKVDWKDFLDTFRLSFSKEGLFKDKKIYELLNRFITLDDISKSSIPLFIIATDLANGDEICFKRGAAVEAVRASISIPGIFPPVKIGEHLYVDGGLVDPLPIKHLKEAGSDITIAVDLNSEVLNRRLAMLNLEALLKGSAEEGGEKIVSTNRVLAFLKKQQHNIEDSVKRKLAGAVTSDDISMNVLDTLALTIDIAEKKLTEANLRKYKADFLIQPKVSNIHPFHFTQMVTGIEAGYTAAQAIIPKIKKRMESFFR
ncbi:MAG: patatin-like phospholipase family protein [Pseudomonadota bacterium]